MHTPFVYSMRCGLYGKILLPFVTSVMLMASPMAHAVFINEFHYDNASGDLNEGVELAGLAGLDLSDWSLQFYNGSNGSVYDSLTLAGVIPDLGDGFGVLSFTIAGLQNGAPDGIALVNNFDTVVQFLSYEGSFMATSGSASGLVSTDIGVAEDGSTPVGYSLQLIGSGSVAEDFSWSTAAVSSFGAINSGQTFLAENSTSPTTSVPEPSSLLLLAPLLFLPLFSRNRWRRGAGDLIPA